MDPTDGADEDDDVTLLAAASAGDHGALRVLYDRHAGWLVVRLSRRCGDPAVVDEVVQDTFVAAWKGAAGYRGTGDVGGWLWGIAVRRLADRYRRLDPVEALLRRTRLRGLAESAEDEVLVGLQHGPLGDALDRLSPELRQVMQATVLDGLTTAEAARLLGIPRGTVKTRMMRARRALREELST